MYTYCCPTCRQCALALVVVLVTLPFQAACPFLLPPPDLGLGSGASLFPGLVNDVDTGEVLSFTIPAVGGAFELTGVATLSIPQGAPGEIRGTLAATMFTDAGRSAFADLNRDVQLREPFLRLSIQLVNDQPRYVVPQMPASGPSDRIYVAGYLDADTSAPAWVPVRGTFDPQTGMLTAAVGIGLLGPGGSGPGRVKNDANQGSSTVYFGYAAVGVGGQEFRAQVVFFADEPAAGTTVNAGDAPLPVRGRIGIQFSNITHPPLDSLTVTSDFGPRPSPAPGASTNHMGTDFRAADGTTVYAAGEGTVIRASCQTNSVNCGRTATGNITGGYIVEIDYGNGEVSRYMHMTNPASVSVGDHVNAGQVIGLSDSTGGVAPHLHFEIKQNGVNVDPEDILNNDGSATATVAIALDFDIQEGSEQAIPVQRGNILTGENLVQYVDILDLDNVIAGNRKLQFVLLEPNGNFDVLAEIPITIRPRLTALTPDQGYFGDLIVATGRGFDYKNPANKIIDMADIPFEADGTGPASSATNDSMEFPLPKGAVFGPVKVIVNGAGSTDTVQFSPYVKGHIRNTSDDSEPVTMQVMIEPLPGCTPLSTGPTSFSIGPGAFHELTLRAGDTFKATAMWQNPGDPNDTETFTYDFFCDGDNTGTITQFRGVDADFYVFF